MSRHLSEVQEAARTLRLQLVPLNAHLFPTGDDGAELAAAEKAFFG
jgi:hypothetical protein